MLHKAPRTFLFLVALSAAPALFGCSRQKEGERCASTNGNSDCDNNLVCTELRDGDDIIHRCCPKAGESSSDSRCDLQVITGDGDTSGEGGEGGMTSSEGEPDDLGANCTWPSDCIAPLTCVSGKCNYECNKDRDCDAGETCNREKLCVAD